MAVGRDSGRWQWSRKAEMSNEQGEVKEEDRRER
jgi:hypothetical protein